MEINFEELKKQKKESILKEGKYCGAEILIGRGDMQPISEIVIKGVSDFEIAILIKSLEILVESLKKKYPRAYNATKFLGADTEEVEIKKGK